MPLTVKYQILAESKFDYPFRIFISGSSQSGKTYFARELLENDKIFNGKISEVHYYHPDYLSDRPVAWHTSLSVPVTYQSGIPNLNDLCKIEKHSCIILDDLYEECINSQAIDYLFRVLSGKKMLSVIIMSQRYFAHGKFGMNIRNNCNFTVLMRNSDGRVNSRVAAILNQKTAITRAIEDTYANNYYPYIYVDSSPRGQVSGYRVYTNIFGKYHEVYDTNGMKSYVIAEKDFLEFFSITNNKTAEIKNGGNTEETIRRKSETSSAASESDTDSWNRIREKIKQRRKLREQRRFRKNL